MLVTNEKTCFSNLGCWTELYNFSLMKMDLHQRSTWNSNHQLLFYFGNVLIDITYDSIFLSDNSSLTLTLRYIKFQNFENEKNTKYTPNEQGWLCNYWSFKVLTFAEKHKETRFQFHLFFDLTSISFERFPLYSQKLQGCVLSF